jgi:hypothetical protein
MRQAGLEYAHQDERQPQGRNAQQDAGRQPADIGVTPDERYEAIE